MRDKACFYTYVVDRVFKWEIVYSPSYTSEQVALNMCVDRVTRFLELV